MFHERRIYRVLQRGISWWTSHPRELLEFLEDGLVDTEASAEEVADARAEARKAMEDLVEKPPVPCHGYARSGGPFPCWAIVLGQEVTAQDFLGEDASNQDEDGEQYLDNDDNPVDVHVRRWGHHFDIYLYAGHPDKCLYHYYLCRQILVEARAGFEVGGMQEITYTGAELAPDPRYIPENVFVRRFSIDCRSDQEYRTHKDQGGVGIGRQVSAMQDDDGQSDPGGESPKITTYSSDDGDEQ